ncbi:MAG: right-handed parallel beta-helix repeat-containing protein [Prevotella sp.]|nr:right-handed parallel beta-helix repeat-containing protein [Prevotella sp.]
MMKTKRMMATTVALLLCTCLHAGDIFVSTRGDDRADGTRQHPLKTLHQALRQARELRRLDNPLTAGGIRILMEGGTYWLDRPVMVRPEDSGTAASPTVIMPLEGSGEVRLSGGIRLEGWTQGTDDERIPADVRPRVWTIDAPIIGGQRLQVRQMELGRLCRATQFNFSSPSADGSNLRMERIISFDRLHRTITIPTPAFLRDGADVPPNLEMLVHQRWATAILRVKVMSVMGDSTVVSFHEPESTLEFEHPWPQPVIGGERGNSSFTLMNAPELMDTAGEWYQDATSGKIYLLAEANANLVKEPPVAPVLTRLLTVCGSAERRVHDVRFENIHFCHSAWTRPSHQGHVTLQGGFAIIDAYKLAVPGLPGKAELENQAWIERPEAAVSVRYAYNMKFVGCRFSQLAATGLDLEHCVRGSSVERCRFNNIGGTALLIGTFPDQGFETHVPFKPLHADEFCDHIAVSGNSVRHCTVEDWGCVGIGAGYVSNLSIVQNEVSDVNYSGICVGWGWTRHRSGMKNNHIDGNHVHDYARQLYDAGGVYTLSYQPGSTIRNNRIGRPANAPYATNERAFCIYFDEATDGFTVENNEMDPQSIGWNKPGPHMKLRNNAEEKAR